MQFLKPRFPITYSFAGLGWAGLSLLTLLTVALYNGFPLVTSDTGTYIFSGMHWQVPSDRPLMYGLFVRFSSLKHTLWGPVVIQGSILTYLLLRCIATWAPCLNSGVSRWVVIAILCWTSSLPWFAAQIMPDVFTAVGVLALGLLWLRPHLHPAEAAWLLLLVLLSATVHVSNLLSYAVLLGLLGVLKYFHRDARELIRRYWLSAAAVLAGVLLLPLLHAAFGGGFVLSRGAPVFLMGRLVETGMLNRVLNEQCAQHTWRLCQHQSELPDNAMDFIWNPQSVLYQTGGWEANQAEFREILSAVACTPRYYPLLLEEGLQATGRQLVHTAVGDGLTRQVENSNAYWKIQENFGYEIKEYTYSLQNRGQLHFEAVNERHLLMLVLSCGLLLTAWLRGRLSASARMWVLLLLGAVLTNAAITANLANVLDRLQARIVWVLPLAALVFTAQYGIDWLHRLAHQLGYRQPATTEPAPNAAPASHAI